MKFFVENSYNAKAHCAVSMINKYAKTDSLDNTVTVAFVEDAECLGDDYRIRVAKDNICIYGNTTVAFNSAAGYLLRHQNEHIEDRMVNFESDFRAVYFANHFYNYYHAAPIEELYEYLESLSLWGQNTLCLWFDMHHFKSISTEEASAMIKKMQRLFKKAKELGMKTSLTHLGNEYYEGATEELLAENSKESGRYSKKLCGYYYTELCPSKKEGEEKLLDSFRELLTSFSSVGLDYIMLWPYDQGGCTCEECYPWGSYGFYKIAKKKAEIAKQIFPNVEIIFSCWRFDCFTTGEWESFLPLAKQDGEWIDYLMVDIDAPIPQGLRDMEKPIVSFPEISMRHAVPWGGFGANPYPKALAKRFRQTSDFCHGGALYSEGIFEDINKVVALELMRDSSIEPVQIVREYCAYHFEPKYADALTDIICRLEITLPRSTQLVDGTISDYPSGKPLGLHTYILTNEEEIGKIADDLLFIDKQLSDNIKSNWRYMQIYLRVMGDVKLLENRGVPNEETDKIYSKLVKIYHAENAFYFVSPITRNSIMENRGNGV